MIKWYKFIVNKTRLRQTNILLVKSLVLELDAVFGLTIVYLDLWKLDLVQHLLGLLRDALQLVMNLLELLLQHVDFVIFYQSFLHSTNYWGDNANQRDKGRGEDKCIKEMFLRGSKCNQPPQKNTTNSNFSPKWHEAGEKGWYLTCHDDCTCSFLNGAAVYFIKLRKRGPWMIFLTTALYICRVREWLIQYLRNAHCSLFY